MIKYAFTGDLNANINSCPPFPGKERHLLRAQLARITHATELCPKDFFSLAEDDTNPEAPPEVKVNEEYQALDTEALKSPENWVHKHPIIYASGRCDQIPTQGLDEDAAAKEQELYEAEKVERFRIIQDDKAVEKLE